MFWKQTVWKEEEAQIFGEAKLKNVILCQNSIGIIKT